MKMNDETVLIVRFKKGTSAASVLAYAGGFPLAAAAAGTGNEGIVEAMMR